MRVLWLVGNTSLYAEVSNMHGGWIGALQYHLMQVRDVQLAVAFPWQKSIKEIRDRVFYYGVPDVKHPIICFQSKQRKQLLRIKQIVDDFNPDIIHVFGTEMGYGLICEYLTIPVIIHIQGILEAIFEAWMPQNLSWRNYILAHPSAYLGYDAMQKFTKRERAIFKGCNYFMGRTEWDQSISHLLAPDSSYYYCPEMLRPEIYGAFPWQYHESPKLIIVSVIANSLYKGADIILRTAKIMKDNTLLDFEWRVVGVDAMALAEEHVGIKATEVGVKPIGRASASELISILQNANVYVHPSYIENSSNAICEAQCIGLPVIATYVGGTTSLVEHEKTGVIVPANDVYMLTAQICRLANNPETCITLGGNARNEALKRHNPEAIISTLLNIYQSIVHAHV